MYGGALKQPAISREVSDSRHTQFIRRKPCTGGTTGIGVNMLRLWFFGRMGQPQTIDGNV